MDFNFTSEQLQFADALKRWIGRDYSFDVRRGIIHSDSGTSDAAWATLAELGMTALPVAEEHRGFNGNAGFDEFFRGTDAEGHILRYDHSVGALAFAVSIEIDDESFTVAPAPSDTDPVIGLGVRYDLNLGGADMEIALGYQTTGVTVGAVSADPSIIGLSIDTTVSGLNIGLNYSVVDWDTAALSDTTHVGIGVGYSMDAISFGLNWGRFDDLGGVAGDESSGFGLSAGYDLGGGASVLFGYSTTDMTIGGVNADSNIWSLGLSMSF